MLDITRAYGLNFLFPENDTAVGASLRNYGEFARPEVEFIHDYLRAAPDLGAFVDVGANIGSIALPVAAYNRRWKVVAVEAHRGLSGVLAANALNNHLYNVETINAAVGSEAGLARFPSASLAARVNFGILGMHLNDGMATEAVRMCTLDEVAPADTRFVKMDVEGFEAEVLKGAEHTIRFKRPAWLIEANINTKPVVQECMRVLLEAGYEIYWLWAPFASPRPRKASPEPPKIRGDLNFVAVPSGYDNPWDLERLHAVDDDWPTKIGQHRYLSRFGFS